MITIQDVLRRPVFQRALVAAGKESLSRPISWVHVGEIPDIGHYLQGGELVLATGVGLSSKSQRTAYLAGLIDAGAAGLVVELGSYWKAVPKDWVLLANRRDFPIIVFPAPVRFLDLSQDINSLVISRHHRLMDDLESLSLGIRHALLNTEGPDRLVDLLAKSLGFPTAYWPRDSAKPPALSEGFPAGPMPPLPSALAIGARRLNNQVVWQTVTVFSQPTGDLLVACPGETVDEHVYLAMDRTAAALAQDHIRTEGLDRIHRQEDAALLEHLLWDAAPSAASFQRFRTRFALTPKTGYGVVVRAGAGGPLSQMRKNASLHVGHVTHQDRHIWVVAGPRPVVTRLLASPDWDAVPTGSSCFHSDPFSLPRALEEANDAAIVARLTDLSPVAYNEMGVWRWILATPIDQLKTLMVDPELGPILVRADRDKLIETLDALFSYPDSKTRASQVLGIHRQTLYARIKVLSDILGEDLLASPRRLNIHLALKIYRYLQAALRTVEQSD
ncbi:PucR family transcriptional regulator [Sulfobacillus harzensis]|uniref:PucR family transcriptional regulator n=1 Tax=Sulfobacillus harzensis TaxID=2729629 RepID=A0A7Y0L5J0_9FIRM|nr:PucR family transcriptional regulator [Sulfobacillus harzensis]NMP22860.1 PucR family transcriptional regulator [Sulfobacillus harzensis]